MSEDTTDTKNSEKLSQVNPPLSEKHQKEFIDLVTREAPNASGLAIVLFKTDGNVSSMKVNLGIPELLLAAKMLEIEAEKQLVGIAAPKPGESIQ